MTRFSFIRPAQIPHFGGAAFFAALRFRAIDCFPTKSSGTIQKEFVSSFMGERRRPLPEPSTKPTPRCLIGGCRPRQETLQLKKELFCGGSRRKSYPLPKSFCFGPASKGRHAPDVSFVLVMIGCHRQLVYLSPV